MTIQYIVDTDWVIHYLNGNKEVVRKLNSLRSAGLAISAVSLAELYEGVYYSTNPSANEEALNHFLRSVTVIGIDNGVCQLFGKERGRLRQKKSLIGDFDLLIAATCLYHETTLITNNKRHYGMVEGLRILSLPLT